MRSQKRDVASPQLIEACRAGDAARVSKLFPKGADPTAGDPSPLTTAVAHDHPEIVALLLEHGAPLEAKAGSELLAGAAGDGSAEIVRVLLARGISPNGKSPDGLPALCCAAYAGDLETVRLLLDAGADPNSKTDDGVPAVRIASEEEHREIVRLLWQRGAEIGVAEAVLIGEQIALADLLRTGGDPDACAGDTPALVLAVKRGDHESVRLLLAAGADGNRSAWPPVWAVLANQPAILEMLLDTGWPIDQPDATGRTPLHRAVERQRLDLVQLLIRRGAAIETRDRTGQTPRELARTLENAELAETLKCEVSSKST